MSSFENEFAIPVKLTLASELLASPDSLQDKLSREAQLLLIAVGSVPAAAKRQIEDHPWSTAGKLGLAVGISAALAYTTQGRSLSLFGSKSLGLGLQNAALGMGIAGVVDSVNYLKPSFSAFKDAACSDYHWNRDVQIMQANMAPFIFDIALTSAGSVAGGFLGRKLYLSTLPANELPKLTISTAETTGSPNFKSLSDNASKTSKTTPAGSEALLQIKQIAPELAPQSKLAGEAQLQNILTGTKTSLQTEQVVAELRSRSVAGALESPAKTAEAPRWSPKPDAAINQAIEHYQLNKVGWRGFEDLPWVRELKARHPQLELIAKKTSIMGDVGVPELNNLVASVSAEERGRILSYFTGKLALEELSCRYTGAGAGACDKRSAFLLIFDALSKANGM